MQIGLSLHAVIVSNFNYFMLLSLSYYFHGYFLRLGPPNFHPQTANCPEETLTREYVQSGYRETVEGIQVCFDLILFFLQECV